MNSNNNELTNLFVSIIIPCRNEEKFIGNCLDSIINNDFPKDRIEVIVVDGMSEDNTKNIILSYESKYPFINVIENPQKIIPAAMNRGIRIAKGDVIMKVDAHTVYQPDYISKCLFFLVKYQADNVGGLVRTLPRDNTLLGRSIAIALSHRFGVGNSSFRVGCKEPIWTDTAYSGCYRKNVFKRIGLYDEKIPFSEDIVINFKLRKSGGKILLVPDIISNYYARSNYLSFWKHNWTNGMWSIFPLKYLKGMPFSVRHMVPVVFVSYLLIFGLLSLFGFYFLFLFSVVLGAYLMLSFIFSSMIALKHKEVCFLFSMPIVFATLHVSYGLGSLWALLQLSIPKFLRKMIS